MEEKKLPRRERRKLLQRQEMLTAAAELFSKKGYCSVSMHEIAEKAEFATGTLYKYFRNKEHLYHALVLEKSCRLHETLTIAIEEPADEIQKLRNYVMAKGEVFRADVPMISLYLKETYGAPRNVMGGFDVGILQHRRDLMHRLAFILESGMKRERFKEIAKPYRLAAALDSITNAFLLLWLEEPERHPYPKDPDSILNILFMGLIDG